MKLNIIGRKIDNIPVVSPDNIVDDNSIIVVSSQKYGKEMYDVFDRGILI